MGTGAGLSLAAPGKPEKSGLELWAVLAGRAAEWEDTPEASRAAVGHHGPDGTIRAPTALDPSPAQLPGL